MQDKLSLREEGKKLRREVVARGDAWQADQALALKTKFEQHFPYTDIGILSFYWPMAGEIDPRPIAREYQGRFDGSCALPSVEEQARIMCFYNWDFSAPLIKGQFNIAQPDPNSSIKVEPDTVIVPLLLCNHEGHRIGMGRGDYDAALGDLRDKKQIKVIGAAYDHQYINIDWFVEKHDQKLDFLVTPSALYDFS